jgi:hypothetical protein
MAATLRGPAILSQARPQPEKLCPITFHLDPTTLQIGYSKRIEATNAQLAQDLVALRDSDALADPKLREGLAERFTKAYGGTYLAYPVLWDEKGEAKTGWYQVLTWLAATLPEATFIQPQAVSVYMEYIPLEDRTDAVFRDKLAATLARRGGRLWFPPGEIDFLARIRTVLAYAPFDDPVEIGNEDPSPHRNNCVPIF